MNVSVVMTCHNEEKYVGTALESVLNQSAAHRIVDIVVVNDGSTDGTAAILEKFVRTEPRLKIIESSGLGPAAGRNLAIRAGAGELVGILDGDDFWDREKLARQLACFEAHADVGIVYGDFVDFSAPDLSDALYVNVRRFDAATPDLTLTYFLFDGPIVPSTALIRRAVFDDVGLFDESYRAYEETDFFLRASQRWRFQHVPGRLTFKRRHANNITRRLDALLPYAERITREWGERSPELARAGSKRMARYYAAAGNDCLIKGARKEGFRLLLAALRGSPASWRVYAYLAIGAVPPNLQAGLRRSVKSLFHAVSRRARRSA